jgi:hypothetical protein
MQWGQLGGERRNVEELAAAEQGLPWKKQSQVTSLGPDPDLDMSAWV